MKADELRQCSARHGQKMYLRCEGKVTEATTHIADHYARDRDGLFVLWTDLVAVYPTIINELPDVAVPASERQVGGDHYRKFKIQPWSVIDEYELSFYAGSVLKYLLRAGHKGAKVEDLKKARHYLDKMIELESGDG